MLDWQALRGRFLVFDGPDGAGKSTALMPFAARAHAAGLKVCQVREPGGTAVGERIRELLLDADADTQAPMEAVTEVLLFMASRAQLVRQVIRPALRDGALVLADRFIASTLAYQGTAGGVSMAEIRRVADVALGGVWPDLTLVFDVDQATAARRLSPLLDRMEAKGAAYHERVRKGFLLQANESPERFAVIDAAADVESVRRQTDLAVAAAVARWSSQQPMVSA